MTDADFAVDCGCSNTPSPADPGASNTEAPTVISNLNTDAPTSGSRGIDLGTPSPVRLTEPTPIPSEATSTPTIAETDAPTAGEAEISGTTAVTGVSTAATVLAMVVGGVALVMMV